MHASRLRPKAGGGLLCAGMAMLGCLVKGPDRKTPRRDSRTPPPIIILLSMCCNLLSNAARADTEI